MNQLVAPSLLAADFSNLQSVCEMINQSRADLLHLDVMDGVFVPNISFGFPVIQAIRKHSRKPLDIHLMIQDPHRYLEQFKSAGANILTIHVETTISLSSIIKTLKDLDMDICLAIKPNTLVAVLNDVITEIHSVCIMSVEPGFGGQTFIDNTYVKINQLKELIISKHAKALIKVDGGVNLDNYHNLINAGVDILVVGTSIFASENPLKAIEMLKG